MQALLKIMKTRVDHLERRDSEEKHAAAFFGRSFDENEAMCEGIWLYTRRLIELSENQLAFWWSKQVQCFFSW